MILVSDAFTESKLVYAGVPGGGYAGNAFKESPGRERRGSPVPYVEYRSVAVGKRHQGFATLDIANGGDLTGIYPTPRAADAAGYRTWLRMRITQSARPDGVAGAAPDVVNTIQGWNGVPDVTGRLTPTSYPDQSRLFSSAPYFGAPLVASSFVELDYNNGAGYTATVKLEDENFIADTVAAVFVAVNGLSFDGIPVPWKGMKSYVVAEAAFGWAYGGFSVDLAGVDFSSYTGALQLVPLAGVAAAYSGWRILPTDVSAAGSFWYWRLVSATRTQFRSHGPYFIVTAVLKRDGSLVNVQPLTDMLFAYWPLATEVPLDETPLPDPPTEDEPTYIGRITFPVFGLSWREWALANGYPP